ncbi:MAG: hypothetical protein HFE75_13050 [Firmicutes bacterium]|nr:hypothetical protein [Bacillota bacterium]
MKKEYDNGGVSMLMNIQQGKLLGETFPVAVSSTQRWCFRLLQAVKCCSSPFTK